MKDLGKVSYKSDCSVYTVLHLEYNINWAKTMQFFYFKEKAQQKNPTCF